METTTETNQNNRELTATEIKITLAQIEDRLTRVVQAMRFWWDLHEDQSWRHSDSQFSEVNDPDGIAGQEYIDARIESYCKSLDIPEGVYLMGGCGMQFHEIPRFMKFAKWWVRGEMDEDIFTLFCYHYCEWDEVDYFWVLMDEPANYCQKGLNENDTPGYVRLESELKRIGTRSKRKAKMNFLMSDG